MVLIEGVGNLSNHRLVAENGLKSENNQCELVSGFHQLNIKEYYQDFSASGHLWSFQKEKNLPGALTLLCYWVERKLLHQHHYNPYLSL